MGIFARGQDARQPEMLLETAKLASYRAALQAFVSRRIADPEEVQDLVQEACTRLLQSCRERHVDEPQAYLFRIASNLIVDRHRSVKLAPIDSDSVELAIRAEQEDGPRLVDLQDALEAALDELSPRCRQIFMMRRFDEMSTTMIAIKLRITPRMVQKHLGRAVAHLYERLGPLRSGQ